MGWAAPVEASVIYAMCKCPHVIGGISLGISVKSWTMFAAVEEVDPFRTAPTFGGKLLGI